MLEKRQIILIRFIAVFMSMAIMIMSLFGFGVSATETNLDSIGYEYTDSLTYEFEMDTSKEDIIASLPTTMNIIITIEALGYTEENFVFHHVEIDSDTIASAGYSEGEEDALYDAICSEDSTYGYRIYGYIGEEVEDPECSWFACDSGANIVGLIQSVTLSWDCEDFDSQTEGEYTFVATVEDEDNTYTGILPTATITILENEEDNNENNSIATIAEKEVEKASQTIEIDIGNTLYLPISSHYTITYSSSFVSNYISTT